MPSIRLRQVGRGDTTVILTNEGLSAVQTLEKRQWDYLIAAYVQRRYIPKDIPPAMRNALRGIATRARSDPRHRGLNGLPRWERGMVIVPKENWKRIVGGLLVHTKSERTSTHDVPLTVDGEFSPRPIYLLVAPAA